MVLDRGSQARRVGGGLQTAAQRIRAERAGSTLSTLGSLSSLSATASLTDKLTSSQYALGKSLLQCCRLVACHIVTPCSSVMHCGLKLLDNSITACSCRIVRRGAVMSDIGDHY